MDPRPDELRTDEPPDDLLPWVVAEWQAVMGVPIGPDTDFFMIEGDSLRAVEIATRLEARLAVGLDATDILDHATPAELVEHLRARDRATEPDPDPGAGEPVHALLSATDKTGLVPFAAQLAERGATLVATGGTARALRGAGLPVAAVHDLTGSPEMLEGRVKALHPVVFGGLLFRRGHPGDEADARVHRLPPIDIVACNFVDLPPADHPPAEGEDHAGIGADGHGDGDAAAAMARVDIGGPALVRAAAKNHASVLPVVDPADYGAVVDALDRAGGVVTAVDGALRRRLAVKAFARTAAYDAAIVQRLGGTTP